MLGTTASSELTLHWDGDTPLFITDANGALQEIKIEGIGFYAPSASTPMTFVDRNQAGFAVASHTSSSPGFWTAASPFHQTCDGEGVSGYALSEAGPDGISDGINTFQGVRSYDPAMGTWTTPDAYAGDASDPMSRKSYMWNRNNAFAYSDPTGFDATAGAPTADSKDQESATEAYFWASLQAAATALDIHALDPKRLPTDLFMKGLAELLRSGMHDLGIDVGVTYDKTSVRSHDNKGNSVVLTGDVNSIKISQSHGQGNLPNKVVVPGPLVATSTNGVYPIIPLGLTIPQHINMTLWGRHAFDAALSP